MATGAINRLREHIELNVRIENAKEAHEDTKVRKKDKGLRNERKKISFQVTRPKIEKSEIMETSDKVTWKEKWIATLKQTLAACVFSMTGFLCGFILSYTSILVQSIKDGHIQANKIEMTVIASLPMAASFVGLLVATPLIPKIGPKRTATVLMALTAISGTFMATAYWYSPMLIMGRFLDAFIVGGAPLPTSAYIIATSETAIRGRLLSFFGIFLGIGSVFCFLLAWQLTWWQVSIVHVAISLITCLCLYILPESPQWYISKGHNKEASEALKMFRVHNYDVEEELQIIPQDAEAKPVFLLLKRFLKKTKYLKPIALVFILNIFQQLTGVFVPVTLGSYMVSDTEDILDSRFSAAIMMLLSLLGHVFLFALVDILGRKPLQIFSSFLMLLSWTALGVYSYLQHTNPSLVSGYEYLILLSLFLNNFASGVGFKVLPLVYASEILPSEGRSIIFSILMFVKNSFMFITMDLFQALLEKNQSMEAYVMLAVFTFLSILFTAFVLPETIGKQLKEIEVSFCRHRKTFDMFVPDVDDMVMKLERLDKELF